MTHRTSIHVLVLGDENVGKSSIISSFLSRQYVPITTPGALGKVKLPPDSVPFVGDNIIATIVDTKAFGNNLIDTNEKKVGIHFESRDHSVNEQLFSFGIDRSSFDQSLSTYERELINDIDSIVLVYDLDRPETFSRLEEFWLPCIEKCREIPVIIAGNKLDIIQRLSDVNSSNIDSELNRTILKSHRQIVSLLQRFKFVREVIMCSAKNLVNIDEIFTQSIQVVVYPLLPLYNLDECRLTDSCKRAFHRIFRIYDCDNDGLLSDEEIDTFQKFAFQTPLTMRDFDGWKQVVYKSYVDAASEEIECESTIVRDGKFTLTGFLAIFDTLISQNRLEVPWKILRIFGYDDNLELRIPDSIRFQSVTKPCRRIDLESQFENSCGLSSNAKNFLTDLFYRFHPDINETLPKEGLIKIFSILAEKCPPWSPCRHAQAFSNSFSVPRVNHRISGTPSISSWPSGPSLSASGMTVCSLGSLSSVDTSDESIFLTNELSRTYSFEDWFGNWYLMSSLSESFTQAELFRLGYISDGTAYGLCHFHHRTASRKFDKSLSPVMDTPISLLPSRATRIFILGSYAIPGRRNLFDFLCGSHSYNELSSPSVSDEGSSMRDSKNLSIPAESFFTSIHIKHHQLHKKMAEHLSYLIFTDLYDPKRVNCLKDILSDDHSQCDLVLFVFNTADVSSMHYVLELEREYLSSQIPRVFIGIDQENSQDGKESTHDIINTYCSEYDLEQPLLISINQLDEVLRDRLLVYLSLCQLKESSSKLIPHDRSKRRYTKHWFCIGGVIIAASLGVYSYLIRPSSLECDVKKTREPVKCGWLRKIVLSMKRSGLELLMKLTIDRR